MARPPRRHGPATPARHRAGSPRSCCSGSSTPWRSPGSSSPGSRRHGATSPCSAVTLVALNVVYLPRRYVPMKFLLPGLFFLAVFGIYPVLYTAYASTTNYGTGFVLTRDQAIDQIQSQSVGRVPESVAYDVTPLRGADGRVRRLRAVRPRVRADPARYDGGRRAARRARRATGADDHGADVHRQRRRPPGCAARRRRHPARIPGRSRVVRHARGDRGIRDPRLRRAGVREPERRGCTTPTPRRSPTRRPTRRPSTPRRRGSSSSADGDALDAGLHGQRRLRQLPEVLTGTRYRGVLPACAGVDDRLLTSCRWSFSFALGLGVAMVLNDKRMRGRTFYRSLLIIPYALPGFMMALVFRGLFNRTFGFNRWLGIDVGWLESPALAMFSSGPRQRVAGLPVHVPRVDGRPAEHPDRPEGGGLRRRRDGVHDVPQDHPAAAAHRREPAADRQLRLQLQQLHDRLPADRGRSTQQR